jgi:hypothetical protein
MGERKSEPLAGVERHVGVLGGADMVGGCEPGEDA